MKTMNNKAKEVEMKDECPMEIEIVGRVGPEVEVASWEKHQSTNYGDSEEEAKDNAMASAKESFYYQVILRGERGKGDNMFAQGLRRVWLKDKPNFRISAEGEVIREWEGKKWEDAPFEVVFSNEHDEEKCLREYMVDKTIGHHMKWISKFWTNPDAAKNVWFFVLAREFGVEEERKARLSQPRITSEEAYEQCKKVEELAARGEYERAQKTPLG